jgi:hypothetical protein
LSPSALSTIFCRCPGTNIHDRFSSIRPPVDVPSYFKTTLFSIDWNSRAGCDKKARTMASSFLVRLRSIGG